jgi:formylglycine-generating enzyme
MQHRSAICATILLTVATASQAQPQSPVARDLQPRVSPDQLVLACPEDMVRVQGDYCSNVVQECLNLDRSIHNANGYVRCLEFAPTKCLSKQKKHLDFCIDVYEYPNHKGEKPTLMVSWNDMKKNCENKGKRLCQDHEWTLACEGPEMLPYPYGYTRDNKACNIDNPQRPGFDAAHAKMTPEVVAWLDQSVPSGSMPNCVSSYGVYDMTGNADEWTINSEHGQPMDPAHPEGKKQYWSSLQGGHWVTGARNRCRPKTTVHNEDTQFYELGGRCCKDAQ